MPTRHPLVTVIVPAYNVAKFIEKCIRSIMAQTYNNIEIIVVNDGSSDTTLDIIEKLHCEDKRIIVINKENGGVSSARNAALDIAAGEYVTFVDGDDYLAENFVEYMLSLLLNANAEFAVCRNAFMHKDDFSPQKEVTKIWSPEEATALLLSPMILVGCWNKFYTRKLIDKYNLRFSTSLSYGEGLYFSTTMTQLASKTVFTNQKIYYYRKDNLNSATTKFNIKNLRIGWKALELIEENLILKHPKIKRMLLCHKCLYCSSSKREIIYNKKKNVCREDYERWATFLRKNIYAVFSFEIPLKNKISLLLGCFFPYVLVARYIFLRVRRIKNSV